MLRGGSVEISFSEADILETIEDALTGWELAIQAELTELHDARANMDYRFDDPTWLQGLGDLIKEQDADLVRVRKALGMVKVARDAILGIGETHGK